ncbi:hypothetical protein [Sorangium sp. So ce233]|uniref:hypothetical protein n=1 Tax=Sorangium sp. So ce233 TaxID=3133290 RepID=UPI003F64447F
MDGLVIDTNGIVTSATRNDARDLRVSASSLVTSPRTPGDPGRTSPCPGSAASSSDRRRLLPGAGSLAMFLGDELMG